MIMRRPHSSTATRRAYRFKIRGKPRRQPGRLNDKLRVCSAIMASVHARIVLAVGAWLLGAGAATGGSLVAVSLLGRSLAAPPTQQLTVAAVNRLWPMTRRNPPRRPRH